MSRDGDQSLKPLTLAELERGRIGNEIHDALIPLLFASAASVQRLQRDVGSALSEPQSEQLAQLGAWIDEAMSVSRSILSDTHPPELSNQSWAEAAAQSLSRLFPDLDDGSAFRWRISTASESLPPAVAMAACRIAVEASRNAISHGKANSIEIEADTIRRTFTLIIRDNGIGFDPSPENEAEARADGHFGLRAMKQRAALLGGKLKIHSRPGGPTQVEFSVDLNKIPNAK